MWKSIEDEQFEQSVERGPVQVLQEEWQAVQVRKFEESSELK